MGIVAIGIGCLGIAVGIWGKEFYDADVISGVGFKRRCSTWSGRAVFLIVGVLFLAAGIKQLINGV